jgi:hypothetical protein
MKLLYAMSALVVAGVCLVAISFVWPGIVGGKGNWNDEKAKEHARLSAEGHRLMHEQAEGPGGHDKTHAAKTAKETEAARKKADVARKEVERRFAEVDAELQRARNRGATTALVLRWLGAVCTIVGGAGYFVLRNKD